MPILFVEETAAPSARAKILSLVDRLEGVAAETRLVAQIEAAGVADLLLTEFPLDAAALPRIVAAGAGAGAHVVVLSPREDPASVGAMLAAGAHEHVAWPCDVTELGARIRAARMAVSPVSPTKAARPLLAPILESRTWAKLDGVVAQALGTTVGTELPLARARALTCGPFSATLTLAAPADGLEVGVGLTLSAHAAAAISLQMIGEADESLQRDLGAELANVTAGVLKQHLGTEGRAVSLRIPKHQSAREFEAAWRGYDERRVLEGRIEGHAFAVACGVRWRGTRSVVARELREDMVVAEDLRNPSGALIVASGTRLTSTMAERLGRHVPTLPVLVCAA